MSKEQLTIIGLEPVGIASAIKAVELGLHPTIITNQQNFITEVETAIFNSILDSSVGQQLWSRFKQMVLAKKIDVLSGTYVWGVFPDKGLSLYNSDGIFHLQPQILLVTLPDKQRVPVFPGWTKAGIWTVDSLNYTWSQNNITRDCQVLLAGSQNNLEQTAQQLTKAGVEVVAVADARSAIPQMLCGVKGEEQVEQAIICNMDREGNPILNTKYTFDVDAVILDYGCSPCPTKKLLQKNSFLFPYFYLASSTRFNINAAINEGTLLAKEIASKLGLISQIEITQSQVNDKTTVNINFSTTWDDDTIICPCENISVGKLKQTIIRNSDFFSEINNLKRYTRVGMGHCQGRRCSYGVKHLLAQIMNKTVTEDFVIQSPLFPIEIGLIAKDVGEKYLQFSDFSSCKEHSLPPS